MESSQVNIGNKNTGWGINTFDAWRQWRNESVAEQGQESIEKFTRVPPLNSHLNGEELNFWLTRFIIEVRRKDGSDYPAESLRLLCIALWRYIKYNCKRSDLNPFNRDNPVFTVFQQTLIGRIKELQEKITHDAPVIQVDPITDEDECKLWQSVFQNYQDNSQCLSYAIYYYNCKEFGLKSAEEHAGVETSQYTCGENQQGKYIQFQTGSSKRKNSIQHVCIRHYMNADRSHCFVRLLQYYLGIIPSSGPFYRRPLDGTTSKGMPRFSRQKVGLHRIQGYMKNMCEMADISGRKIVHTPKIGKSQKDFSGVLLNQKTESESMYDLPVNEMHPVVVVKQEPKEPELVVNQEMNEASELELVVEQEVNEANELELVEEQEVNEANKLELVVKQEVNEANEPEIVVKQELNYPNCPSNSLFDKNAKKVQHSLIRKPIMIQPKGVPTAVKSIMPLSGVKPPITLRITLVDNVPTLVPVLQPTTNVQQPLTMQPSITGNISLIPCSSVTSLKSSNMPSVSGNQAAIRLQPTVVLSHNQILGNQLLSTSVKSAQIKHLTKMIPIYPVSLTKVAPLTTQPSEKQAPVLQPEIFEPAISQSPVEVDKLEQKQPSVDEILSETQKSLSSENTSACLYQYQPKRFEKITTGDMEKLQEPIQESQSTKANTKWGVKMFQDWSRETTGSEVDFHNISKEDLNEKLKYFYAEAKPKLFENCAKVPYQSNAYNRRSMNNVRAALNRHLKHIDKNIDIVRDPDFRESNTLLIAKWKLLARSGLLPPVKQRKSIDLDDLKLICNYVYRASFDPFSFRFRVWFCIAVNFVSLGIGFHQHLTLKSFDFKRNDEGQEYAVLKHDTKNQNTDGKYSAQVMYASSVKDFCPVAALRLMISKTEPEATSLFNRHIKGKIKSRCEGIDLEKNLWYSSESLGKGYFTNFLTDICKQVNCSKVYTASSLRMTAIQAKFDPILKCIMCNIQR